MKKNLTPIASAVAMFMFSVAAQAQQATATTQAPDQSQPEQVVVTGIRASLQSAVNIKRNADAVVDSVSAEDLGKFPDSDVGEALGRIPGVTVGRAFGQGASVSVRGSDPQMTYTTLNGQTIASTGWYDQQSVDRSFNYSLLPPELIGGMDVYKSSQADLTEGGIGGTVIIKTRKPLDMAANTGFVSAQVAKGSVSTKPDKGFSGLYSWKNEANTFGALIGAGIDKGEYIRRGIESDTRWSQDVEPTTFVQERKRTAFNIDLQARPMKGLDLDLNYLKLKLSGDNSNTSQYIFQDGSGGNSCTSVNAANVCTHSVTTNANTTPEFVQAWVRRAQMTSDSLTLNEHFKGDGFRLDSAIGTTKADGGTSETTNYQYGSWVTGETLPVWTGTIDATGKQIHIFPTTNQSYTVANFPATTGPAGSWATSRGPNEDKENYGQADLTLDLNWDAITSFKTGVRYSQHTFKKSTDQSVFSANTVVAPSASLYSGTIAMGPNGWSAPKPNIDAMMANTNANIIGWVPERSGYGDLQEDNTALYGMFNFEQDKLHGNAGLRYVGTNVTGKAYAFDGTNIPDALGGANDGWSNNIVSQSSSYHYVLPSLNVVYDATKNVLFRLAAAKAMTRPNFDNMFLSNESGYSDNVPDQTITYGSVGLKPTMSTQFDFGAEYYYGKGNLLALTYFHKDINNFITTNTKVNQQIGVVAPHLPVPADNWTVNQYVNAGGGTIDGLEAQINHAFDNGFGVSANFTLTNAQAPAASYQDQLNLFTQSSKDTANLVAYYETSAYFVRTAYNWRSEYMLRETGWYGNRMHAAYGQLDLSAGWNITPKIVLMFEATNLNKADDVQYGVAATNTTVKAPLQVGYPAWSFMGEATYTLSLKARF
ncbi:iron complex outermembrane receptor protein [Oxalobacteraceae bacterium GrIS 2.11]